MPNHRTSIKPLFVSEQPHRIFGRSARLTYRGYAAPGYLPEPAARLFAYGPLCWQVSTPGERLQLRRRPLWSTLPLLLLYVLLVMLWPAPVVAAGDTGATALMAPKAEQEATVADQPQKLPAAATANDQPQPVADDPWAADYYQHQEGEVFSPTMSLLKAFGVLLLMIGLMLFVAALLKRLGFGQGGFRGQGELIRVIETRSVGPKKYLAVVEVGGEFLLLGIGDQQINLLTRLENDELIRQSQATGAGGPGSSGPGGFAGLLAGALKQRRERKD